MTRRSVHVVPFDALGGRDHTPSATCYCSPISLGTDLTEPAVVVYRHRFLPTTVNGRLAAVRRDLPQHHDEEIE